MSNFETNISQNLVATQNEIRKNFKEINERITVAQVDVKAEIAREQKIRTRLEADLQVVQFSIRSLQEDIKDIQERLQEEFNKPKRFSFFRL